MPTTTKLRSGTSVTGALSISQGNVVLHDTHTKCVEVFIDQHRIVKLLSQLRL